MIISGLEPIKCILRPTAYKACRAFSITLCYIVLIYDVNLTNSPLDRLITAAFTKGYSMKTSLINILCLYTIQIIIIIL